MADARFPTPPAGGAPAPDADRVAAIQASIRDEAEACAAFAETERAALVSLNGHTLARTRDGDLGECLVLLGHIRDRVDGLDPARLQPRRGLAGLFDSRGARLKAFRAAFASAASAAGDAAGDLGTRGGAIAARDAALDHLWAETRDAIAALDIQIAAARNWLDQRGAPPAHTPALAEPDNAHGPVEAQADAEADHAGSADLETGETPKVATLPHPMDTRLGALLSVRAVALGRLPLLRAAQNADCHIPVLIRDVCDGIEAWRADWRDALGLAGRKPKKVQPDRDRLIGARTALTTRLSAAERALSEAQRRRAELDGRITPAEAVRKAA